MSFLMHDQRGASDLGMLASFVELRFCGYLGLLQSPLTSQSSDDAASSGKPLSLLEFDVKTGKFLYVQVRSN